MPQGRAAPAGDSPGTSARVEERARQRAFQAANRRRFLLLSGTGGALPGLVAGIVVGLVVGPVAGVVAGVVVLVAVAGALARRAVPAALRVIGGGPVSEGDFPSLANLVDGLCATFGVHQPQLWLVDDPVPNACALGARSGHGVLVVTSGLVERMGLIEMEGVVAHELAHLRRHDAAVSAMAVATAGRLARLTGGDRLVHAAVGHGREYAADRVAALGVRYPPGLRDALAACAAGPAPTAGSVFTGRRWAATRWLWIDPMAGEPPPAGTGALDGRIDATTVRRDALAEW
ncbi:MAG: M48 family metalloprotease [Acidimicrobiales bacterium]